MQSLNLHGVKDVKITPMQEYNDSHWKKIIIQHEGGYFEIIMFSNGPDIPIEYITHSGVLVDD